MSKENNYLKCDCGSKNFKIRLEEIGEFGLDHVFICANCKESLGGIVNDPFYEVKIIYGVKKDE